MEINQGNISVLILTNQLGYSGEKCFSGGHSFVLLHSKTTVMVWASVSHLSEKPFFLESVKQTNAKSGGKVGTSPHHFFLHA